MDGGGEEKRAGGIEGIRRMLAPLHQVQQAIPKRVARRGEHAGIGKQLIGEAARAYEFIGPVAGGLLPEERTFPRAQAVETSQRLGVEIGIDASVGFQEQATGEVHPHDRLGIAVEELQHVGVFAANKVAQVMVRPQAIVPVRVQRAPCPGIDGQAFRHVGVDPGLMEDGRYHRAPLCGLRCEN